MLFRSGLTGTQGVLIPASNVKHLMLRPRVVEAVAAGRFHVHAIATIDQGLALLTGMEAGVAGIDGRYPAGSVNARVVARLEHFAAHRRAFNRAENGADER